MSDRTEQPTLKKLREARKRGEVPRSREVGTAVVLLAVAATLNATSGTVIDALQSSWRVCLNAAAGDLSASPTAVLEAGLYFGADMLAPVLVVALIAGGLAAFLQVGPLLSAHAVTPKLERIDPVRGARNLFSQRQLLELLKSIVKVLLIGTIAWVTLRNGIGGAVGLAARDAHAALSGTGSLVLTLLTRVGAAMGAVAVLDLFYQRWRYGRDQMMTKEEVKREHRESEGDPHTKQQRERQHREIVAHGVLEEVRSADVLIVNPTHLAVALRYDEEGGAEAPEVVARGQDDLARRMIEAAQQAGVPVMRDVPLARALFELEVGDEIPEVLYEAVAVVLRAAWDESGVEQGPEPESP